MANVERYAAKGVFDPAAYSQAVKVSGAQTTLYLAGQVAYDDKGGPAHRGDFTAQARAVFQAVMLPHPMSSVASRQHGLIAYTTLKMSGTMSSKAEAVKKAFTPHLA